MQVKLDDHCQTADDVRAANRRVREFHRRMMVPAPRPVAPAPAPAQPPAPKVPPQPAPRRMVTIQLPGGERVELPVDALRPGSVIVAQDFMTAQDFVLAYKRTLHVSDVLSAVAKTTGVAEIDIKSRRRTQNVVAPRHLVMALARRLTMRSLPEIGRLLGGRDHTTVLHAHQKYGPVLDQIAERIGENASLAEWVAASWETVQARDAARVRRASGAAVAQHSQKLERAAA